MGRSRKKKSSDGGGAPGWIVTFADLMSLLLTFFILILSFAEIDASKFKRVMGSIKMAFGVQKHKVYEFMETSSNPFEASANGKDSDKVISNDQNNHMLNVDANELCGMEERAKQVNDERSEAERFELHKRLKAESRLAKYFNILLDDENKQLRVGIKPEAFFHTKSTKIKKEKISELNYFFKKLEDKKLDIAITNHGSSLKSSDQFKSWKLSSDRSLVLGYLSQKFPQAKNHNIEVKSLTDKLSSDQSEIEFTIKINESN